MLLEDGERVLHQEAAEQFLTEGRVPGVLYLTSERLVYEIHRTGGLLRPGHVVTHVDVRLRDIRNVSVVHQRIGPPKLQVDTVRTSHTFRVWNPGALRESIVTARTHAARAAPPPPPPPPPPPTPYAATGAPVVVQVTPGPAVERQVVKVRCRHCGNLGDEATGRCGRCGAPL